MLILPGTIWYLRRKLKTSLPALCLSLFWNFSFFSCNFWHPWMSGQRLHSFILPSTRLTTHTQRPTCTLSTLPSPTHTMSELQLEPYTTVDELLLQLAQWCINNNFYRKDRGPGQQRHPDPFRHFTDCEIDHMNETSAQASSRPRLDGGFVFLDESNGTEGMIRLYLEPHGNPKWSFWMEDGKHRVCFA